MNIYDHLTFELPCIIAAISDVCKISKRTNTFINNMASVPEPVLVLYKSSMCRHCATLSSIWDTTPNKNEDSVTAVVKKIYPKMRFNITTSKDNTGRFDENITPKDLIRYGKWYPMVLLIPGRLWDAAMSKLGPKNDVKLIEGVQIMNGAWEGNDLKYVSKYDIRKPANFGEWIREAMNNEDFKKAQNGEGSDIAVPTIQHIPSQSIRPIFTDIVRPGNAITSHTSTGSINHGLYPHGDVCSMRIISRPR